MGVLNLYKTRYSDGGYELIWSKSGDMGRYWFRSFIEVKSNVPFKVKNLNIHQNMFEHSLKRIFSLMFINHSCTSYFLHNVSF